jgi:hypothetical protein
MLMTDLGQGGQLGRGSHNRWVPKMLISSTHFRMEVLAEPSRRYPAAGGLAMIEGLKP